MAKIYKISGNAIDANEEWNEDEFRWLLERYDVKYYLDKET